MATVCHGHNKEKLIQTDSEPAPDSADPSHVRRVRQLCPASSAGPKKSMAISEIDVRRIFATALLIIRDRLERFLNFAPKHVCCLGISNRILEILSALEKQDQAPYCLEKCFLADLALMATRVLEAYSLDESGLVNYLVMWQCSF